MKSSKMLNMKSKLVALAVFLICFLSVSSLYGQDLSQNNEMRKSLDSMFEYLDRSSVPTGLLRDYAVEYEEIGMPRHILSVAHVLGGYEIKAECIDTQYNEYLSKINGALTYNWGVKYPNRDIQWVKETVPNLNVQLQEQNEKIVVFLEIIDANGNKTALQHIELNSQDVYVAQNQNLYIDAQGQLYKENKSKYSYSSGRLYISYRPNIPSIYKERIWMATTAKVLRPIKETTTIDARYGGPILREILLSEELEYIKNNSVDNEVYRYTVILQNYNSKAIQFIPVTFTYKTKI